MLYSARAISRTTGLKGQSLFLQSCRNNSTSFPSWTQSMNKSLKETDPEMFDIIEHEKHRLYKGFSLIPSENMTSIPVLEALGSIMQNKYSEGYPGQRYYGGNQFIDMSERLCQQRALDAFNLDKEKWGVNVQPLSGSPANFIAYSAVLSPHDRILSLDLPHGGHLSHGYQTPTKKISAVSVYFETVGYRLNEQTGLIDYDKMEELASYYRPKLVVAGASAYPRLIDYKRIRQICDQHNAYLLSDMAHISGLVAAGVIPSPFEYSDIVTTTTHKSLRGPRGAMIFYRKGIRSKTEKKEVQYDLEERINAAVFPGHQGGPHNHTISALAVALKQAQTEEYKEYQSLVLRNCKRMADLLLAKGYKLVSGGTDNHLLLVDLRDKGVDGARVERVLELCNIAVNKNTVPGDKSALVPGGIRLGTPAITTRGLVETDMDKMVEFIDRAIKLAIQLRAKIESETQSKKVADFKLTLDRYLKEKACPELTQLAGDVESFAASFPTIGYKQESMLYK